MDREPIRQVFAEERRRRDVDPQLVVDEVRRAVSLLQLVPHCLLSSSVDVSPETSTGFVFEWHLVPSLVSSSIFIFNRVLRD